jgi:hypothetical protein
MTSIDIIRDKLLDAKRLLEKAKSEVDHGDNDEIEVSILIGDALDLVLAALSPCGDEPRKEPIIRQKLSPDPEHMNAESARCAASALRHFRRMTGADREDALGDLLCDLMHWCDRSNFDFELALYRARRHHTEETTLDEVEHKR